MASCELPVASCSLLVASCWGVVDVAAAEVAAQPPYAGARTSVCGCMRVCVEAHNFIYIFVRIPGPDDDSTFSLCVALLFGLVGCGLFCCTSLGFLCCGYPCTLQPHTLRPSFHSNFYFNCRKNAMKPLQNLAKFSWPARFAGFQSAGLWPSRQAYIQAIRLWVSRIKLQLRNMTSLWLTTTICGSERKFYIAKRTGDTPQILVSNFN